MYVLDLRLREEGITDRWMAYAVHQSWLAAWLNGVVTCLCDFVSANNPRAVDFRIRTDVDWAARP